MLILQIGVSHAVLDGGPDCGGKKRSLSIASVIPASASPCLDVRRHPCDDVTESATVTCRFGGVPSPDRPISRAAALRSRSPRPELAELAGWFEVKDVEPGVRLVGEGATGSSLFVLR